MLWKKSWYIRVDKFFFLDSNEYSLEFFCLLQFIVGNVEMSRV